MGALVKRSNDLSCFDQSFLQNIITRNRSNSHFDQSLFKMRGFILLYNQRLQQTFDQTIFQTYMMSSDIIVGYRNL